MKVPKPTDADRERFRSFVPDRADVEIKPMFGNLGAFVNRNMFMGLFGSDIGVTVPDADRQQLLAERAELVCQHRLDRMEDATATADRFAR